uniref:LIM zinc-binding domain-containing protein n=1 Tax=Panagrellus redivivus TaxID=6233 RepID=A0A7E4ZQ54_PANRE
MARSAAIWLANGFAFGISFAAGSELYRVHRGAAKNCDKCHAPVGNDGQWRGEREPRSYSIAWGVRDAEWAPKQRLARRRKCFGCQKSLDVSSVIVLDRAWHRKCLTCSGCKKPLSGNRYYMFDNRVFDQACFQKAREAPALQPSHTSIVDYRYPAPVSAADHRSPATVSTNVSSSAPSSPASESSVGTPAFRGSAAGASSSTSHAGHDGDDLGKMSHEMKKRLANDLLNALMSLRTRERRPQTASPESSIISATSEILPPEKPVFEGPSVASRRRMFEKKASKSSSSSKDESE